MTETEKLKAELAELQKTIAAEKEDQVDPKLLAKAEQFLQFSVNDIKIALDVLDVTPTEEQLVEIEKRLISSKLEQLGKAVAKQGRPTKASW